MSVDVGVGFPLLLHQAERLAHLGLTPPPIPREILSQVGRPRVSVPGQHEPPDRRLAAEVDAASLKLAHAMSSAVDGRRAQLCRDFAQVRDIGFTHTCMYVVVSAVVVLQSCCNRGRPSCGTVC